MPTRLFCAVDERIESIDTRWSLIRAAHNSGDLASATDARRRLVLRYVASVRRYIGAMAHSTEVADELAQDVVVRLMKGDFAGADPERGRFRMISLNYLITPSTVRTDIASEEYRPGATIPDVSPGVSYLPVERKVFE